MLSKTHTKYIQSLQHKKFRDEAGVFIAEGPKIVSELLNGHQFICKEIIATENWLQQHALLLVKDKEIPLIAVKDADLQKISSLTTANHVLAIFEKKVQPADIDLANKITLMLDTIQDPGNMGTIIRIADWFGIQNLLCSLACADMYNPKVVQSSMGSLGRMNMIYTDLTAWMHTHKQVKLYATALSGKDIRAIGKINEGMIVIGNESRGVDEAILNHADEKITICKTGAAESLNAAVAAGIILSHLS